MSNSTQAIRRQPGDTIRSMAYGGGVQSTAMLVLAAQGVIDYDTALFANVGDDSEHPATLDYMQNVAIPWAEKQDRKIQIIELKKRPGRGRFAGEVETLWKRLTHPDSLATSIPLRMSRTGKPARRACTQNFKVEVLAKWYREHGATAEHKAVNAIGISTDEWQRAGRGQDQPWEIRAYPLLDLDISRQDAGNIIHRAGLPVPPKSSCFFCPFHSKAVWAEMRRDEPELFEKSVWLEKHINDRLAAAGQDPMWMTDSMIPLDQAIPVGQPTLFGDKSYLDATGECDSGYCFM